VGVTRFTKDLGAVAALIFFAGAVSFVGLPNSSATTVGYAGAYAAIYGAGASNADAPLLLDRGRLLRRPRLPIMTLHRVGAVAIRKRRHARVAQENEVDEQTTCHDAKSRPSLGK
jgi:hypothetical protein